MTDIDEGLDLNWADAADELDVDDDEKRHRLSSVGTGKCAHSPLASVTPRGKTGPKRWLNRRTSDSHQIILIPYICHFYFE